MVFVQLYITDTTNGNYFDVPLYGIYDINLIGIQFNHANHHVLQIQSDILRFQSSSRPSLLFMSNNSANNQTTSVNYSAALEAMPSIKNADCNGRIFINVLQADGTALAGAFSLIINLEATCAHKAK
jgi:hypothetical protein